MSDRSLTGIGILLILFPFVSVFAAWKMWVAFGIGIVMLLSVLVRALRNGSARE